MLVTYLFENSEKFLNPNDWNNQASFCSIIRDSLEKRIDPLSLYDCLFGFSPCFQENAEPNIDDLCKDFNDTPFDAIKIEEDVQAVLKNLRDAKKSAEKLLLILDYSYILV